MQILCFFFFYSRAAVSVVFSTLLSCSGFIICSLFASCIFIWTNKRWWWYLKRFNKSYWYNDDTPTHKQTAVKTVPPCCIRYRCACASGEKPERFCQNLIPDACWESGHFSGKTVFLSGPKIPVMYGVWMTHFRDDVRRVIPLRICLKR